MVAMVALFPTRQLGVELGSILLIFTGQVWNMAFSVYSSLKNIPREMLEAAEVYRLELVADVHPTGVAVLRHRSDLELHDVGGRRVVLPDGVRDVRAGRRATCGCRASVRICRPPPTPATWARSCGAWRP